MATTGGEDEPLPLRELARRAGISDGTLRNWVRRRPDGLRSQRSGPRTVTVTVTDLRAFCAAHPRLRGTRIALAHLDGPAAGVDAGDLRGLLTVVVTAVRAATAAHLDLTRNGAEQASDVAASCRAHAATLASALEGLDDALIRVAQPLRPEPPPDHA